MFILSINTASNKSNIVFWKDGEIYELFYSTNSRTYGETLTNNLRDLLNKSKWNLKDVDIFSVVTGPGSFTGLRIGVVTIKTLAQIYKKPTVGISYLEALAFQTSFKGLKVPVMSARKGEVHAGFYIDEDPIYPEDVYSYNTFLSLLNKFSKDNPTIIIGDISEDLKLLLPQNIISTSEFLNSIRGETLVYITLKKYQKGNIKDYLTLLPDYRQKSSAEINWEKKHERTGSKN